MWTLFQVLPFRSLTTVRMCVVFVVAKLCLYARSHSDGVHLLSTDRVWHKHTRRSAPCLSVRFSFSLLRQSPQTCMWNKRMCCYLIFSIVIFASHSVRICALCVPYYDHLLATDVCVTFSCSLIHSTLPEFTCRRYLRFWFHFSVGERFEVPSGTLMWIFCCL